MGRNRSIINEEFKEDEEIDTKKKKKHKSKNYSRKRKPMKEKNGKVQIWVKKRLLNMKKS